MLCKLPDGRKQPGLICRWAFHICGSCTPESCHLSAERLSVGRVKAYPDPNEKRVGWFMFAYPKNRGKKQGRWRNALHREQRSSNHWFACSVQALVLPDPKKKANPAAAEPCGKKNRLLRSCIVQVSLGIQDPDGLLFGLEAASLKDK